MKKILAAAILALAPAAYASDEVTTTGNDSFLEEEGAFDSEMQRDVAVRCVTGERRFGFSRGFAVGRNYYTACNQAAREAFSRCSGRFYRGPFRACDRRGGRFDRFDDFDRRPGDRARFLACMNSLRCEVVRRR